MSQTINQDILKIEELRGGRYSLSIDGNAVGLWDNRQLAQGINLGLLESMVVYRERAAAQPKPHAFRLAPAA